MIEDSPQWSDGNTMMMLTLHNLAKEYGVLPSEALRQASTFDLYVLDLSCKHSKYLQQVQDGTATSNKNFGLTQQQMQHMLDTVRPTGAAT